MQLSNHYFSVQQYYSCIYSYEQTHRGQVPLRENGVVVEEQLDAGIFGVDPLKHLMGDVRVPRVALKVIPVKVFVVHIPVDKSTI